MKSTVLTWGLIPLVRALGVSANLVERDSISWSREQCHEHEALVVYGLDNAPLECGKISVPLDHADSKKGTIELQLVRVPASQQPSKGGIFVGSSNQGTIFLAANVNTFVQKFGPDWDIIAWDIRGTSLSEPDIQDLVAAEKNVIWGEAIHPGQFESHGNLTTDADANFFRNQSSIIDQGLQKLEESLKSKNGNNLTYLGATPTTRDVVAMADALYGSDKDINFYGTGYGSYLGMMLTQMFPQRIGKIILDGVMNPQVVSQYHPILGFDESLADANQVLEGLYYTCALVGPSNCSIAAQYPTSEGIKGAVNQLLETAYKNWNDGHGGHSYNTLIAWDFFLSLSAPKYWHNVLGGLAEIANVTYGSTTLTKTKKKRGMYSWPLERHSMVGSVSMPHKYGKRQQAQVPESGPVVGYWWDMVYETVYTQCPDTPDVDLNIVTTEKVFEETIRVARTVTPMAASIIGPEHFCHRYATRSIERYSGPWNTQPKNVVLVIGNEADPTTPFRNAQFVTKLLGSKARLVQQAGYGHSSLALDSTCTTNTIKQYLQGTVPDDRGDDGPDVFCQVDQGPFGLPGNTPWNINTSKNGDALTSGPSDPGLANFPGLNPPPVSEGSSESSQSGATMTSAFGGWSVATTASLGILLLFA
ncbi:hypothetical protein CPB86DRAFT_788535 [Serendipita vermifera]|nr:hypothetical protein CPB86DRAFT_788535 [Serendipita vermifera]